LVVALTLAFLSLYPLSRVLGRLFVHNGTIDLSAVSAALRTPDLAKVLFNTIVVVVASLVLALFIGSFLAWITERTDARMGLLTEALPMVPFFLPSVAAAVGWVMLLSPRAGLLNSFIRWILGWVGIHLHQGPFNIYSMYGLVLAYTVFMVPYVFLLMSAGLRNMDPALEEQSRVCGASISRTFLRVTLAALRPSLAGACLLMVWFGAAMYSVPAIIGTGAKIEVLSVRIVQLLNFTYPPQTDVAVGLCSFIVLAVGTAWYLQGRIAHSGTHATVGGRGQRGAAIQLGVWRLPARCAVIGYLVVASILPIVGLALVALNGFWSPTLAWSHLSLGTFREVLFQNKATRAALVNSLKLALAGGLIGITAAAILALFVQRTKHVTGRLIDAAIRLPAVISSIVLVVGIILAFGGAPFQFHGTIVILLLAYVVLFMPQASVAADAAAGQVGQELPEASQVSGAGGWRTFRKVYLPIMGGGLAAGWALLFVQMVGDLTASALLSGPNNPTVGFQLLETFNNGSYAQLAALALILSLATSTVVLTVLALTRHRSRWGRSLASANIRAT
jgi:iron(III) transport system permease protein